MRGFLIPLLAAILLVPSARAQDCAGRWLPGMGTPGVSGDVWAMLNWDPDGEGPQPRMLVVAGAFAVAGNQLCNNIAAWDGSAWHALGAGTDGSITALTVYNGELVACGAFTLAGGNPASHIAKWNGSVWSALGTGLTSTSNSDLWCMAIFDGELIVGGPFTKAGGVNAKSIARWNGSLWQPVGTYSSLNGGVYSLCPFHDELVVGGSFSSMGGIPLSNIARWDGLSWNSLGSGIAGGSVNSLIEFQGDLVACGQFGTAGGIAARQIARWNGAQWDDVGGGIGDSSPSRYAQVMCVHGGELVVGGNFNYLSGSDHPFVTRWTGSEWLALEPTGIIAGGQARVTSLATLGDELWVGGSFDTFMNTFSTGIVRWSGDLWHGVHAANEGFSGGIGALHESGGYMVIGGSFFDPNTNIPAVAVTRWDGSSFTGATPGLTSSVWDLCTYQGDLIAGGFFSVEGGAAKYVARWNGSDWLPFGSGVRGGVYTVAATSSYLYCGGNFKMANGAPADGIAVWDGSAWNPVGDGLSSTGSMYIYAMTPFQGDLVVAGSFQKAGQATANNIARWNGTQWSALGGGLPTTGLIGVYDLAVFNGTLIACGSFKIGSVQFLAQWNGSQWIKIGASSPDEDTYDVSTYRGSLVAGGVFSNIGGVAAKRIARWNGSAWSPLGIGMNGTVNELGTYHDELLVAGHFSTAGGQVSSYFARWTDTNIPWVARQPESAAVSAGQDATFTVVPASGYDGLSYQWLRTLDDGSSNELVNDAHYAGADGPTLTIFGAGQADVGVYFCRVSNSCGSQESDGARSCAVPTSTPTRL